MSSGLNPRVPAPAAVLDRTEAEAPAVRAWRVLHACEYVPPLLPAIESQSAAGMKPYIVTPAGAGTAEDFLANPPRFTPGSLLTAWNEVRGWRRCLLEAESQIRERGFDIVHAHSFQSGMASVRNCPCVVYDIVRFVEAGAKGPGGSQADPSWLDRSFRVAEQFVISRAAAVVVHNSATRRGAEERGALAENLFQIPSPLPEQALEMLQEPAANETPSESATFLAIDFGAAPANARDGLPAGLESLLRGFALLLAEEDVPGARLLLPITPGMAEAVFERAHALEIADAVHPVSPVVDAEAFLEAQVVIAGATPVAGAKQAAEMGCVLNGAARGLFAGRAVLAADCDNNRDLTPQGRGVLWYRPDDPRDLASRCAFLWANANLRRALVAGGRRMLLDSRSPEAIGRAYDRAYQRAWLRRRSGGLASGPAARLEPIAAQ